MSAAPSQKIILLIILILTPLAGIGIDLYTPSLPAITLALHTSASAVKLTIASYLLGYGLGQLVIGPVADSLGRRPTLIVGMFFFLIVTLLASLASTINLLIFWRLLQGVAVGVPGVIFKSLVTDCFTGKELAKTSTSITTVWALGPILAPAVGGYLQHYFGWRSNFYFLTFYGLICLFLIWKYLPETAKSFQPFKFPVIISNYRTIILHQIFLGSVACICISYFLMVLFNLTGPFLIENLLGYSALAYGHIALFMGFAYFFGSLLNKYLINFTSTKKLISTGIFIMILFSIIMTGLALAKQINLLAIILPIFVILFSCGFVLPNAMAKCLSLFPDMSGSASAVMGGANIIGCALLSSAASWLETSNQFPVAFCYLGLCISCWIIYLTSLRKTC